MTKKQKFTNDEIARLTAALNKPIKINGHTGLPLEHAIYHADLNLFKALLRLGADIEATCDGIESKLDHSKPSIKQYLKQVTGSDPLCYKPFINALSTHKVKKYGRSMGQYLLPLIGIGSAVGAAIINMTLMLNSLLPTGTISGLVNNVALNPAVTSVLTSILANPLLTPIFGIVFNTAYLGYRHFKNYDNPAKSNSSYLIATGYDLASFTLNILAYASYFVVGATPIAGLLFVAASAVDATRGFTKLYRAYNDRVALKEKLNNPEHMHDGVEATKTIRAYERSNYKIASISTRIVLATAIIPIVAVYSLIPLGLVATSAVFAGMGALYVAGMIATAVFDSFFEKRAQKKIATYKAEHTIEEKPQKDNQASSYAELGKTLDDSSKHSKSSAHEHDASNDTKKESKAVKLRSKTNKAFSLFEKFYCSGEKAKEVSASNHSETVDTESHDSTPLGSALGG